MNIQGLLKQAQKMQVEIAKAEKKLKETTYTAKLSDGMVEVEVNGGFELTKISIDSKLLTEDNKEMLEDMVLMATNEAIKLAQAEKDRVMNQLTGGVKVPGAF